jgi:lysophospholipase L1-like esterase
MKLSRVAGLVVVFSLSLGVAQPVIASSRSVRAWPANADVVVIGDSLSYGENVSGNQGTAYRNRGLVLAIDAAVGRFAERGVAVLRQADKIPAKVVFALGTNDSCYLYTTYPKLLEQTRALTKGSKLIVVTLYSRRCSRHRLLNDQIRAFAKRNPDVVIAEWGAELTKHRSWMLPDGVHLTPEGYQARARFIAAVAAAA